MNNPYLQERMVELKMQELHREIEQISLLKEAGLSNPNWLSRKAKVLGGWLIAIGEKLQKRSSVENQAYQTTSSKFAA